MNLKLTIKDRIYLPQLLPQATTFENIIRIKDIKESIEFKKDEINKIEFKSIELPGKPGTFNYTWNKEKEKDITINLDAEQVQMLKEQVKTSKNITEGMYDLCVKIKELK